MAEGEGCCLALVKLRGTVNTRRDVKDTLRMLRLSRVNHATLIPSTPVYLGMLQKVKEQVTWGEVSPEVIFLLLRKRGETSNRRRWNEKHLEESKLGTLEDVSRKLSEGKLNLKDIGGLKPIFRLHPPSKGFKRILKRNFRDGGELGYRGKEIDLLLKRMI